MKHFDVIVVGGGHAGTEAAYTAARAGARTALVTLDENDIGAMSCNPAMGGLGKGHLVREIDALGGLMGRAADAAGIQFRLLNRSKGPAVRGPRAQQDRNLYRAATHKIVSTTENLTVVIAKVDAFKFSGNRVVGITLDDGTEVSCGACVLTAGTFLNGTIHIGHDTRGGGRFNSTERVTLSSQLTGLSGAMGRLKTGTPPRLLKSTINFDILETQHGDEDPSFFSVSTKTVQAPQIHCSITHTNERTHEIIADNLKKSAMYGGAISGKGPRYCPSIEDKVVRFADKTSHQVFLEPETFDGDRIYPNGISTSLPVDVQLDYVRSIVGLEAVEIAQPGYAVEYDFFDPRGLDNDLRVQNMENLYFAGQINGTTGYEEAAAQGLVAGLNASRSVSGGEKVIFSRSNSYIGVLIDDLTSRGVSEPYRMFTSRAEFRLALRCDNADQRLTEVGRNAGIVSDNQWKSFSEKMSRINDCVSYLSVSTNSPKDCQAVGLPVGNDGRRRNGVELLSYPEIHIDDLSDLYPELKKFGDETLEQVENDAIYAPLLERQRSDVVAMQKAEGHSIPKDFDFGSVAGLSKEIIEKLSAAKPANMAQAQRIDGITPVAMASILFALRSK